jgi:hypothetical protein
MNQDSDTKVPKLTKTNFATEFKDAFLAHVVQYGDAGHYLATNQRPINDREPTENDMVLVLDPVTNLMVPGNDRKYPATQLGQSKFDRDWRIWKAYRDGSLKVLSKLLSLMEREVRDKVESQPDFRAAMNAGDLFRVWELTEEVVRGRGAISVYTIAFRLLKLKQKSAGDFVKFGKEWRDLVTDLLRTGDPAEVLVTS